MTRQNRLSMQIDWAGKAFGGRKEKKYVKRQNSRKKRQIARRQLRKHGTAQNLDRKYREYLV